MTNLSLSLSCSVFQLFATPWTVAYQAPLSMGFSRQQYWSGLTFPSPGDLPNPGIEPGLAIRFLYDIIHVQAINAGEGVEKREPSYTVGGNANWFSHYGE